MTEWTILDAVLAGAALALLIAAAGWALYTGLSQRSAARAAREDNARLWALMNASPATAMTVRGDGRVEASATLVDWLGLTDRPRNLAELDTGDAGLEADSATALLQATAAAQRGGRPFRVTVRARSSQRLLVAIGDRAPPALTGPGGVLVWFVDATEMQGEVLRLANERDRLHAAYEALTGLIEAAPMPMWYRLPDLSLAMVNGAYVRAVDGGDADTVVDRGLELVEGASPGAAIARDTGEPQAATVAATISGARRALRIHDVPLGDGGIAGYAIDIEDLEQARTGNRRSAEAQRALLDRLSAGVAQFAPDRTLAFCNQPFRRLFAMRPEWLTDRPEFDRVLERMREAKRLPEVRDFPGWKAERRGWFRSPENVEEQWHLPGGVHLRVVAQPLPEGGLLLIFEDRTEQVQLASARDTLLRVRTATFDNLFEALGVFAADGRLQIWNTKFRSVWDFDIELLNQHPRVDALAREAASRLANPARAAMISDLVRSATVDRLQRGGRIAFADGRHFEFAAVPLPDGNALLTMIDVSDSRRMEQALRDRNEALEAADRVKTAFVANMSYELRTPLTSIQGFAEMLHGGFAGELSESGTDYAEAILSSVERLSVLIDDVLDLTQSEAGPTDKGRIDLERLAHEAAETVLPGASARGSEIAVEVQGSAGSVTGDLQRLKKAVEHVLWHAVAGLADGGRVLLHVDGDPDVARIVVSDDGPGMDADAVAHAFDRFARMTRGSDRALGLGLPIARQFVEAHGGRIAMLSEPGAGTLVTIELPR